MKLNPFDNIHAFSSDAIPDLADRVIIVTGGNAGIGKQTVLELSRHNPKRLYMAARSRAKFDAALEDIRRANPDARVDYLELDLARLASIRTAAKTILERETRLDILINNAGIMAKPPGLTPDGYEIQFGTNFIGPAALTKLLMPLMVRTATSLSKDQSGLVRVVNVSSAAGYNPGLAPGKIDWKDQNGKREDLSTYARYAVSKLAQILYTKQAAKHWPEVTHIAVHPGRVETTLLDEFMVKQKWSLWGVIQRSFDSMFGTLNMEQGALTSLWAATWASEGVDSGGLYSPVGVPEQGSAQCRDVKVAEELWEWTEGELKSFGV